MQERQKKYSVHPGCLPLRTEKPIQVFVDEYKWSTKEDDYETYTQIIFNLTERRFKREELPGPDDYCYGYYGPGIYFFVDEWTKYLGHKYHIKVIMPTSYRSDWNHPSNGRIMQMIIAWYFNDVSFVYKKDLPFYPESYNAWYYTLLKPAFGVGVGNQNTYYYCPVQTIQSAIKKGIECPFEESFGQRIDLRIGKPEKICTVGDADCTICKYGSKWPYFDTDRYGTERRNCYHSTVDPERIVKFNLPPKEQAIASINYFVTVHNNKIDIQNNNDNEDYLFIDNILYSDRKDISKLISVFKEGDKLFCILERRVCISETQIKDERKKHPLKELKQRTLEDIRDCILKYDLLQVNKMKMDFNMHQNEFED